MNNDVVQISNDVYFLPGVQASVFVKKNKDDATKPAKVKPENTNPDYSPWGDDNLYPQNVMEDLEENSIALRVLSVRSATHFGRGIIAYIENEEGKKQIIKSGPVFDFFKRNMINARWPKHILALETFANSFPELIMNKNGDKINTINILDPVFCRYEKMDEKTLRINKLFYSAKWPSPTEEYLQTISLYDPDKFDSGKYKDPKFIYPIFYESLGTTYYHKAVWHGVRNSGWLEIANKVPQLKKYIMKNQMIIKYHVEIPDEYFTKRWPPDKFSKEEIEAKRKSKIEELNSFLTDVENSGKSIVTFKFYDSVLKQEYPGWTINTIDNKLKDDAYLPDSQAANSEILFSMGVDPTLLGAGIPGGKLGAGSGSDKREAYWMLNANMGISRVKSLEVLYFIRDFNKWPDNVQFDYEVVDTSQTQDEHPTKTEKRIDQNTEQ